MLTKNLQKIPLKFICEHCNYTCSKQSEFNKHLLTAKHEKRTMLTKNLQKISTAFQCSKCDKQYKSRMGLWQHKNKCDSKVEHKLHDNANILYNDTVTANTVMQLIKQNQEFKDLIIELSKKDTTTNNNTTNNNQKFNLNFFLNDTCKDAMNMSDFIENMNVQFEDIENIGRNGYVAGMTDMILSRIKTLDVTKRPMHCTDMKRETIYIKDNDVWEKDANNVKLHKMIGCIAHQNCSIIPAWRDKYPDSMNTETPKFEFCITMMRNVLGDAGEEQTRLDNKVIRNVTKHINVAKQPDTIEL